MSKVRNFIVVTIASLTVSGLGVAIASQPAYAAESICSAYTNGEVWQTSTRWGRVRERVCLEYITGYVRGRVDMQLDYPSFCSLTIGLPPSAGASCPISIGAKSGNLDMYGTKITVKIKRGSTTTSITCEAGNWDGASWQTMTRTCRTSYYDDAYSNYTVYAADVMGDVKNDGDGWKVLAPVSWNFGSPS